MGQLKIIHFLSSYKGNRNNIDYLLTKYIDDISNVKNISAKDLKDEPEEVILSLYDLKIFLRENP